MIAHAPLQPSSAGRVVQCPGSRGMCELIPDELTDKADEGTLAHAVNVAVFNKLPPPEGTTEEMMDGAELWMEAVDRYRDCIHIEERIDCPSIHPDNWGTPDAWHFNRGKFTLRVWDYKFGHRHVEAYENWQLINYAAGVMDSLGITGLTDQHLYVILTIVQPRSYHPDGPIREWVVKGSDLRGYINALKMAWESSLLPDAPTKTGGECRDCSARHACATLQSSAYIGVDMVGVNTPFDLSADALGNELKTLTAAKELMDCRISGLQNEVLARIKSGANISGWTTQQGRGREKWNRPIEEVLALGEMMGVSVGKPALITPKQAIKAGLPADLVRNYTETPAGEVKLVQDDGRKARNVFALPLNQGE